VSLALLWYPLLSLALGIFIRPLDNFLMNLTQKKFKITPSGKKQSLSTGLDFLQMLLWPVYRVFVRNLGKQTVYCRGLYSIIWASTWGKSLVFIGHFSRFRHNKNITGISGSNWPLLTASPKEKNKQNTLFKHLIFLFAQFLQFFHLMFLYFGGLIIVCRTPTHYKGPMSGNALKNHFLRP
jgi:hypothetical protein